MNTPPDNFGRLLQLLKCKRYEQPPPGYFDDFADRVTARLERTNPLPSASWWERLVGGVEIKPLLVGAYGVAVCGLLLSGISISQMASTAGGLAEAKTSGPWWTAAGNQSETTLTDTGLAAFSVPLATTSFSSMTPVIKERASLSRGETPGYQIEPVRFTFGLH